MGHLSSADDALPFTRLVTNGSSDPGVVSATSLIKTEDDDALTEATSSADDPTEPTYLSSTSFVDLVETIFIKKEDRKPVDSIEHVMNKTKEEPVEPMSAVDELSLPTATPEFQSHVEETKGTSY